MLVNSLKSIAINSANHRFEIKFDIKGGLINSHILIFVAHENVIKEDETNDHSNEIATKEKRDRLFSSLVSLPTFVKHGEKVPLEVLEGLSTNRHLYAVLVHNYPSLLISSRSISDSGYINEQVGRNFPYASVPL